MSSNTPPPQDPGNDVGSAPRWRATWQCSSWRSCDWRCRWRRRRCMRRRSCPRAVPIKLTSTPHPHRLITATPGTNNLRMPSRVTSRRHIRSSRMSRPTPNPSTRTRLPVPGLVEQGAGGNGGWGGVPDQPTEPSAGGRNWNKAVVAGVVAGLIAGLLAGVIGIAIGGGAQWRIRR